MIRKMEHRVRDFKQSELNSPCQNPYIRQFVTILVSFSTFHNAMIAKSNSYIYDI